MMKKLFPAFGLLLIFLTCCKHFTLQKNEPKFSEFIELGEEGMIANRDYVFDSIDSLCDIYGLNTGSLDIVIRYTDNCKIKTLPLEVEVFSLDSPSINKYNVEMSLYDDADLMNGKGNYGVYELCHTLLEETKLSSVISISMATHEKETQGIISLGFLCKTKS